MTGYGSVEVLLTTYNGERYLRAQLDSLLAQTLDGFTIVAADDGSSDSTLVILAAYARAHPKRLRVLAPSNRLGASANFGRLIDAASADYLFFCDQDDVWLPEKMSKSLDCIAQLSERSAPGTPLLVHTDLVVVDERLKVLGPSYFHYVGSNPARNSLAALLLGNVVTGCTIVVNRALFELARPVPQGASMFDHWLALVAAGLGRIAFLNQPTILYRQHGANLIGADKTGTASLAKRFYRIVIGNRTLTVLARYSRNAELMLARYGDRVAARDRARLLAMACLWSQSRWRRLPSLYRVGLFKPTLATNAGLALLVLRDGGRLGAG